MELILTRIAKRKEYTIGRLSINTENTEKTENAELSSVTSVPSETSVFLCNTLEPTWRDYEHGGYKVKGKSAIPEGRYAVVISYSPKFKRWLPLLLGGPEFNKNWRGIRIHAGNTARDTQGCILVGDNRVEGQVLDSNLWLHRLKCLITEAKDRGEAVWLTIK